MKTKKEIQERIDFHQRELENAKSIGDTLFARQHLICRNELQWVITNG
jgi:hypothetical protein